jgi:hypothetical protein
VRTGHRIILEIVVARPFVRCNPIVRKGTDVSFPFQSEVDLLDRLARLLDDLSHFLPGDDTEVLQALKGLEDTIET